MENVLIMIILGLIGPLLGYLSGSVLYAVIFSKCHRNNDIRHLGSKNPGFTNSLRSFGYKIGVIVLILDILKTIIPTIIIFLICRFALSKGVQDWTYDKFHPLSLIYLTSAAGILGHMFPIFFKFKGGKGVSCYVGLLWTISPFIGLSAMLIFISVVLISKYASLSSITMCIICPFLILIPGINFPYLMNQSFIESVNWGINHIYYFLIPFFLTIFLSWLIIFKHKSNIQRLINHNESKIIN